MTRFLYFSGKSVTIYIELPIAGRKGRCHDGNGTN